MGFWQSQAGEALSMVAAICVAIAAIAGGLKGIIYLWERAGDGGNRVVAWWREKRRVREALASLTAEEGWPNGSKTLPQSLTAVYKRAHDTDEKLDHFIAEHRAAHIDIDAWVENRK